MKMKHDISEKARSYFLQNNNFVVFSTKNVPTLWPRGVCTWDPPRLRRIFNHRLNNSETDWKQSEETSLVETFEELTPPLERSVRLLEAIKCRSRIMVIYGE